MWFEYSEKEILDFSFETSKSSLIFFSQYLSFTTVSTTKLKKSGFLAISSWVLVPFKKVLTSVSFCNIAVSNLLKLVFAFGVNTKALKFGEVELLICILYYPFFIVLL